MKIYTGRGDYGNTNLIGGSTVKKTDLRVKAYGEIDELNSNIGLLYSTLRAESTPFNKDVFSMVEQIQIDLFNMGTFLADVDEKMGIWIKQTDVKLLESMIDKLDENLPELDYFILPSGAMSASQSHICRTVTRRVERSILDFDSTLEKPLSHQLKLYINRLSDFFFVLARYINNKMDIKETEYTNTGKVFHN